MNDIFTQTNNNMKKLLSIALWIFLFATAVKAEIFDAYSIGAGISTFSILGDNPAQLPIIQNDTAKRFVYGGSFDAVQSGFAARLTMYKGEKIRVPVDIDFTIYSSGERYPVSGLLTIYYWHEVHNLSIGSGFYYVLTHLDWAKTDIYVGADLRGNIITRAELTYRDHWRNDVNRDTSYVVNRKYGAFRIGSFARLGIEGQLKSKLKIDASIGVGVLNLFPRDNNRGELLTPLRYFEKKEQIVPVFNFMLLLKYSL